jgi:predicted acylesterase/phospholipase RssA
MMMMMSLSYSSGQYRYQGYKQRTVDEREMGCKKQERIFKNTCVAVNIKTKEILALEVTDEKVHDGKVIKQLIEQVLNNNHNIKTKSLLGDGAYDSNENFKYLKEKRIQPIIKVKRNSIISSKNNKIRNEEVQLQTKDYHKWKKKRKYGQRWLTKQHFLL